MPAGSRKQVDFSGDDGCAKTTPEPLNRAAGSPVKLGNETSRATQQIVHPEWKALREAAHHRWSTGHSGPSLPVEAMCVRGLSFANGWPSSRSVALPQSETTSEVVLLRQATPGENTSTRVKLLLVKTRQEPADHSG